MPTFTPIPSATAPGDHQRSPGSGYLFGLVFWPIFFGVMLIALVWGLWKWKANFGVSSSPISTPKPSTEAVFEIARIRGAPIVQAGRPSAAHRMTDPTPPLPAYIYPPGYDHTLPPYSGSARPS